MRRPVRPIWIVFLARFESPEAEGWEAQVRFSTERAASVFARAAEKMDFDSVVGPHRAALFNSGKAAIAEYGES